MDAYLAPASPLSTTTGCSGRPWAATLMLFQHAEVLYRIPAGGAGNRRPGRLVGGEGRERGIG
eukprot:12377652-Prorocentrum_lima.AAC.1